MSESAKPTRAWEPLTPRGVARFARESLRRLLLVQGILALLAAAAIVWFLASGCFPVINAAIQNLPPAGEILSGRLDWLGSSPKLLANGRFLALDVDLDHSGQLRSTADVQIEFGRQTLRIFSLFGYVDLAYPQGYNITFNRNELEPVWGAWATEFLMVAGVVSVVGLLLSWWLLATIYFLPVWLLGLFTNRDLNFRQSWRLCGAALMPGALLMTAAILLYGFGFWNLVSFGFVFGAHLIVAWIYLFLSLLFLPRMPAQKRNPFGSSPRSTRNPFRSRRSDDD